MEQTGRRPVVIWQSDALTRVLASVLVLEGETVDAQWVRSGRELGVGDVASLIG
jgi:hypothetical protein